jgi:hypothetical protein
MLISLLGPATLADFCNSLYPPRHCDVSARFTRMKLRFLVPLTALLTGCPEAERKDTPPAPSAAVSAVAVPTATATAAATAVAIVDASTDAAPVDAGKVADAGKTDGAAPKK